MVREVSHATLQKAVDWAGGRRCLHGRGSSQTDKLSPNGQQDIKKSEFYFLPPKLSFVTIITLFSINLFGLPHLAKVVPILTLFKVLPSFARWDAVSVQYSFCISQTLIFFLCILSLTIPLVVLDDSVDRCVSVTRIATLPQVAWLLYMSPSACWWFNGWSYCHSAETFGEAGMCTVTC
jgi:hypothetical protein